ncbi:MAG TPA: hypothetical protein VHU40_02640 [Polyangia bacterium]|nr:hypothetical protein [Polyangia bacterium]
MASARATAAGVALAATSSTLLALLPLGACSDPCCTVDGFPIDLMTKEQREAESPSLGGLVARARDPKLGQVTVSIDSSSPLTFYRAGADERPQMTRRSFDLLGAIPRPDDGTLPRRAKFDNIPVLPVALDPAGAPIVVGGDLLRDFSIQIDFPLPAITFWAIPGGQDAFFGAGQCVGNSDNPLCYSVLHFNLLGGGELTAVSEPDFLGLTGPVEYAASRVLLRACAVPPAADPVTDPQPLCCTRSDANRLAAGTNLALVVATGVGPLVLSESAWTRVAAAAVANGFAAPPSPAAAGPLFLPSLNAPFTAVTWSTVPRLALVDLEADTTTNPGACVELAQARRLEWVERHRLDPSPACVQPCDTDVREPSKAKNAAAYVELGGEITVAIVPDGATFLQTLRAELRQQGPQVDGLLGTDVLAQTSLELDYTASPSRAVFSCAPGTPRASCWSSPRCVRQAAPGDIHSCFGLPPQSLPEPKTCLPSGCS